MSLVYFDNNVVTINGGMIKSVIARAVDPLNPLGLPPYTIRVKYATGTSPSSGSASLNAATKTLVNSTNNIWDVTYENLDWKDLFFGQTNLLEVIGANTTGVTILGISNASNDCGCFENCSSLTRVALFDTSNVTTMARMFVYCNSLHTVPLFNMLNVESLKYMFYHCIALQSVPFFDTSHVNNMYGTFEQSNIITLPEFNMISVTNIDNMCYQCGALKTIPLFRNTDNIINAYRTFAVTVNVESGALALYQQLSSQTNPPRSHSRMFSQCGTNTETGSAELEQIPSDWKN